MTVQWVRPPEMLAKNIERYGERVFQALHALAAYWGQGLQDQARQNAPWTDRTGNARSGLFFAVDGLGLGTLTGEVTAEALGLNDDIAMEAGSADTVVITLGHTVFYGKYLELSNGGRYAVVMSTIEGNLGGLEKMLAELFR